jgi:phospholipid/cholesterol/gamma-HCH transport system substrate-binding protein
MRRSFRDVNKIALGVVTIVVLGAIIGGAFAAGTLGFLKAHYQMTAVFTDSAGLKRGAPVRVAGIDVGKVTGISADWTKGQVLVSFDVNSGVHLGPGTRCQVGTATFLGGDFLQLTDTESGQSLQQRPRSERRIPLERTKTAYTVLNALSDASKNAAALDPNAIDNVIRQIGGSLANNVVDIPSLVTNLETLGTALNQRQAQFDGLITNGERVAAALKARDAQLGHLIDQAAGLLDALNSRRVQLASVLGSGSDVVNRLARLIEDKRTQINGILSDFHSTLGAVQRQLPNVNTSLARLGPVAQGLSSVITPQYFSIEVTGISALSLSNLNKLLNVLLGPAP